MYAEKTDYDDIEMSSRLRNILRWNINHRYGHSKRRDRFDYSRDGISHVNIVDFLLGKVNINVN